MKDYDLFLSYKSEDVRLARLIAEELLARGVVVWFAEYTMQLQDAACPEAALASGTQSSTYGLLITNDRFSQSEFTRLEARLLLEHCGHEHLLDLRLPEQPLTHPEMPSLLGIPPQQVLAWPRDKVLACQEHLGEVLGLVKNNTDLIFDASYTDTPGSGPPQVHHNPGHQYSVDVRGWGEPVDGWSEKGLPYLHGRTTFAGSAVEWQLLTEPSAFVETRPLRWSGEVIDDRDWLRRLRESGELNLKRINAGCLGKIRKAHWSGAHLVFSHGYSHLAMTYRAIDDRGEKCWVRGYSLVFPIGPPPLSDRELRCSRLSPSVLGNVIFTFVFFFYGPFPELMKLTKQMDRMVDSLNWEFAPSEWPQVTPYGIWRSEA